VTRRQADGRVLAVHWAAGRIQRAWKIHRWRRQFWSFSEGQLQWVGSLDWLQQHNLLYGTELADSDDVRWWLQQRTGAPLDREVDPWGSERLLEHLHRMWYGGRAVEVEVQVDHELQQQAAWEREQQRAASQPHQQHHYQNPDQIHQQYQQVQLQQQQQQHAQQKFLQQEQQQQQQPRDQSAHRRRMREQRRSCFAAPAEFYATMSSEDVHAGGRLAAPGIGQQQRISTAPFAERTAPSGGSYRQLPLAAGAACRTASMSPRAEAWGASPIDAVAPREIPAPGASAAAPANRRASIASVASVATATAGTGGPPPPSSSASRMHKASFRMPSGSPQQAFRAARLTVAGATSGGCSPVGVVAMRPRSPLQTARNAASPLAGRPGSINPAVALQSARASAQFQRSASGVSRPFCGSPLPTYSARSQPGQTVMWR